jgi:hypothetical protein
MKSEGGGGYLYTIESAKYKVGYGGIYILRANAYSVLRVGLDFFDVKSTQPNRDSTSAYSCLRNHSDYLSNWIF